LLAAPVLAGVGALAVAGGLGYYWWQRLQILDTPIRESLVADSNAAQNKFIRVKMAELTSLGHQQYAHHLGNFIQLKAGIEKHLHSHDAPEETKERIEQLVDTLVSEVVEQFDRLVDLGDQKKRLAGQNPVRAAERTGQIDTARASLAKQIERAYLALRDVSSNVSDLVDPLPATTTPVSERLEDIIRDLHDEAEIARRVATRLAAD
jgi:hypothetical protein